MFKFFTLFALFYSTLFSADLTIIDGFQKSDNFTLKYYDDENSLLTIDEIEKIDFNDTLPSQFTMGYKYDNVWFKLEIENTSKNEDFVLYFTESIWSILDLYTKENATWKVQKNGLNIPINDRAITDSSPAFKLHIVNGNRSVFYIKGNTIASQIGEFELYTKKEFFNPNRVTLTEWYTIYAFVLFIFILLNLYNFIIIKERVYAYYMVYVFTYIVFTFMHSGVYISFGFPNWQEGLHVLGQLVLSSLLLFSMEFLKLSKTYPVMEKAFKYLAVGAFIFALLLSQNIPYSTVASNVFFSGTLIFIVYVAVNVLKNGFSGAMYYLIALMLFLPAMAMMAMNFNAMLVNNDFTRYMFLAGAFVEIFLFTILLTNRYVIMNNTNNLLTLKTMELENIRKQLTIEATTDILSGLYNRRYFYDISEKYYLTAKEQDQNLSVLMIDIDKFKDVNDTYGHYVGDNIIESSAKILTKNIRKNDVVARYGGEEFIILLEDRGIDKAIELAEWIRVEIENNLITVDNGDEIHVTVSIGATQLHHINDKNIDETIKRCDKALYQAKDQGRNIVSSIL
ncbi:MAG: GGDEF domain-containing protein [Epsilonproteobacteria bacterium]|nr:MAG: GGDEF domain-containing protein [Campylobacterota bacterium]